MTALTLETRFVIKLNHRKPTEAVCVAFGIFIVNVWN